MVQKWSGGEQPGARESQGIFNANTACSAEAEAYNSDTDTDIDSSHRGNQAAIATSYISIPHADINTYPSVSLM